MSRLSAQADPGWPEAYRGGLPEPLTFNPQCRACTLHGLDRDPPEPAVGPTAPPLEQVRLVVISDYPGAHETWHGYCMVDNQRIPSRRLVNPRNAGSALRHHLQTLFGLDTYQEVYYTNALKCERRGEAEITTNQRKTCIALWLSQELAALDKHCPEVPVLVAGKQAFIALQHLDPAGWKGVPGGLHAYRRRGDLRLGTHPLVVTVNPAQVGRSVPRIETETRRNRRTKELQVRSVRTFPIVVGSAEWHFQRDLEYLRPYV